MSLKPRPGRRRSATLTVVAGLAVVAVLVGLRYRRAAFIRNAEAFHRRYDEPEFDSRSTSG